MSFTSAKGMSYYAVYAASTAELFAHFTLKTSGIGCAILLLTHHIKGNIAGIDNSVKIIDRRQSFYVTGIWPYHSNILPGTMAEVEINCGEVSVMEYLTRLFKPSNGIP